MANKMKIDGLALARGFAACAPVVRQFGDACAELHRNIKRTYAYFGRPYGDTDEGMMRWYGDVAHGLNRLRAHNPQPTGQKSFPALKAPL